MVQSSQIETGLRAELARISESEGLIVALDFDGTLAELSSDPWGVRALPESVVEIERLASRTDTKVAIISGRSLHALKRVVQFSSTVALVGSHGAETESKSPTVLTEIETQLLEQLREAHREVQAQFPGAEIEIKPAGAALHTRALGSLENTEEAQQYLLTLVAELDHDHKIHHRYGKEILEFTLRHSDKGEAIQELKSEFEAQAVLFIGDDVTDEDGFAVLTPQDVGIKVGEGQTRARFRVGSPVQVARVLELVRQLESNRNP